ncbi:unnamed protein product [Didymodactylos carnosus]|uniref:EGF-like domain-containing protein n=1 Tax=Didymodactylos carnosus TaxID=1234261 RepID=A0A813NRK1_9BILA|nr:unnamed protein product [Didymodactylos carnosus]CAF0752320.1 unnamed protein product [Didymodactylos carnosus]CAF3518632.1 unnamed protein product [Didymodactylos carnosus]CAF3531181.1 unnamed protein product [Didymodactylos carnosus]
MQIRIPYLNYPCILNETCYHGQCARVQDLLTGWYEYCLCAKDWSGFECEQHSLLSRADWFVIIACILIFVLACVCTACIPLLYAFLEEDFYPQIIECGRQSPYAEIAIPGTTTTNNAGVRVYRIPSEYISTRRTIVDGLIPLHSVASLAYLSRIKNLMFRNSVERSGNTQMLSINNERQSQQNPITYSQIARSTFNNVHQQQRIISPASETLQQVVDEFDFHTTITNNIVNQQDFDSNCQPNSNSLVNDHETPLTIAISNV